MEKAGFIWAYMGPPEKQPPLPKFEWMDLPPSHYFNWKIVSNCNYFQSLEGSIDPTHGPWLHGTLDGRANPNARIGISADDTFKDMMPRYTRVEDTEHGVVGVVERNTVDGNKMVNVSHWVAPSFTPADSGRGRLNLGYIRMRVPIDDENSAVFRIRYDMEKPLTQDFRYEYASGEFLTPEMKPGTYIPVASKENDYLIDRFAQRNFTFTGIKAFALQDVAVIEDQFSGPISDRSREHLVASDEMIIRVRRHLLKMARDLGEGVEPAAPHRPELFAARPATIRLTKDDSIEEAVTPHLSAAGVN